MKLMRTEMHVATTVDVGGLKIGLHLGLMM